MNSFYRSALGYATIATESFHKRGSFPGVAYTRAVNFNARAQTKLSAAISAAQHLATDAGISPDNVVDILTAAKATSDAEKATLDAHA